MAAGTVSTKAPAASLGQQRSCWLALLASSGLKVAGHLWDPSNALHSYMEVYVRETTYKRKSETGSKAFLLPC